MKSDLQLTGLQQNCFSSRTEQTVSMPSDRLRKKITNGVETFWGKMPCSCGEHTALCGNFNS